MRKYVFRYFKFTNQIFKRWNNIQKLLIRGTTHHKDNKMHVIYLKHVDIFFRPRRVPNGAFIRQKGPPINVYVTLPLSHVFICVDIAIILKSNSSWREQKPALISENISGHSVKIFYRCWEQNICWWRHNNTHCHALGIFRIFHHVPVPLNVILFIASNVLVSINESHIA